MPTGAELFVDTLARLGITEIFTLVGDHLNEVLSVAGKRGLRILDMRHESAAAHAADALGRIRRKPALSLVTGGPGHTNSLTGIATAFQMSSPLIAVSGAPAASLAGRQVFQVIDQVAMTLPVVKWAVQVQSADHIPYLLGRAYAEASSGRMGPVHLTIPVDMFTSVTEKPLPMPSTPPAERRRPDPGDVERAIELLEAAERPVVIAGSGVWWADAREELLKFLKKTRLPYYSVTMARGVVPDSSPMSFGYADGALNKAVQVAFPEADLVLVLGKRLDYRLALGGPRLFSPKAKFIQVDIHPQELGANRGLELGICADVKQALRALVDAAGNDTWKARKPWITRLGAWDRAWKEELERAARDRRPPIHPAAFFRELRKALPGDVLYSWDGGDFAHWGRAILPAETAGGWLRLGPLGTIGSSLPNALALQMAYPSKPVVMITGDGSLGFYLAELDTAVRHNLPVVVVVGNDAGWGLERELQCEMNGTTVACELRATRYDLIMKGFGGDGESIQRLEEVGPAIRRALAAKQPYLLNVRIRGTRSPFTEWQIAGRQKLG